MLLILSPASLSAGFVALSHQSAFYSSKIDPSPEYCDLFPHTEFDSVASLLLVSTKLYPMPLAFEGIQKYLIFDDSGLIILILDFVFSAPSVFSYIQ